MNFFELLGLPLRFAIGEKALEDAYFAKQREHHPDKLVNADAATRTKAIELSMQVNDAYDTLKNPVSRAEYLLMINGIFMEEGTIHDPVLLTEMMELREQMHEAGRDGRALLQLVEDTKKSAGACITQLDGAFAVDDLALAQTLMLRLQYLHKALEEAHVLMYRMKAEHQAKHDHTEH